MIDQQTEKKNIAIKFIPHSRFKKLNRKAVRAQRNSISDLGEKVVIERQMNLPIVFSLGDIDQNGWHRCMVAVETESGEVSNPFIDIKTKDYEALPTMTCEVDC